MTGGSGDGGDRDGEGGGGRLARAIDFIARFDPPFRDAIRGASAEEIAEVERLGGGPLPAVYRDFLAAMGRDPDWIDIDGADLRVEALLRRLRERTWAPPPAYRLIGVAREQPAFDLYLELGAADGPRVVAFPEGRGDNFAEIHASWWRPVAGSLEEALGCAALRTCRMKLLPSGARLVGRRPGLLGELPAVLRDAGFELCWFSNGWTQAAERADAVVIASEPERSALVIEAAATGADVLAGVEAALRKALPDLARR